MSQQINLYNAQLLYRKQDFSLQTMLQGVGLIAAGLLAFYAYEQYQVQALKAQTQELTKTHADVQGKLLAFTSDFSQKQAKKMLDAELKKAEAELQAQGAVTIIRIKPVVTGTQHRRRSHLYSFVTSAANLEINQILSLQLDFFVIQPPCGIHRAVKIQ